MLYAGLGVPSHYQHRLWAVTGFPSAVSEVVCQPHEHPADYGVPVHAIPATLVIVAPNVELCGAPRYTA